MKLSTRARMRLRRFWRRNADTTIEVAGLVLIWVAASVLRWSLAWTVIVAIMWMAMPARWRRR